ncbi:MAG: hypothetical protein ACFCUO_02620 [Rhodospirillales bacterium]
MAGGLILAGLAALGRRAPAVLVIGVVLGLLLPGVGAPLRPLLPSLVVMVFGLALVRIRWSAVAAGLRRPWWIGGVVVMLMAAVPATVHAAAVALRLPADVAAALVMMACAPPIASAPTLALLLGIDAAAALTIVVAATLAMPLIAPPLLFVLIGLDLGVAPLAVALRLAATIALGVAVAAGLRWLLGSARIDRHGRVLDGASAVVLVLFVIAVMTGVQARLIADPATVLALLAAACAVNFGLQALFGLPAAVVADASGSTRRRLLAVALMAGNRNVALFLAALPEPAAELLTVFVALYQVPIYATPLLAGPLYRRLGRGEPALR